MNIIKGIIFTKAWDLFRQGTLPFGECLHRCWQAYKAIGENAFRIEAAKIAAGITEETETWNNWKLKGFEVIHGSKALFGCDLIYAMKGDGEIYKARFFGRSQVQPIGQQATA